jgi:hypothetical protein
VLAVLIVVSDRRLRGGGGLRQAPPEDGVAGARRDGPLLFCPLLLSEDVFMADELLVYSAPPLPPAYKNNKGTFVRCYHALEEHIIQSRTFQFTA